MIKEIRPDYGGPCFEVMQLLHNCDGAFNDSAADLWQVGMSANFIACISHMLCDERILACLILYLFQHKHRKGQPCRTSGRKQANHLVMLPMPISLRITRNGLRSMSNPFTDGPFVEDLGMFKSHLGVFKDVDAIKGYIKTVVSKVEAMLKNHKQNGHHSIGKEWLQEIK